MSKLFSSPEMVSLILTDKMSDSVAKDFVTDPKAIIAKHIDYDFDGVAINVVQNTASDIHVSLPYYDFVGDPTANFMHDQELDDVSGGEIIITLFICGGCLIGGAVAAGLGIAGSGGLIVGGVIGGAIAAAAVTGAVVGGAVALDKEDEKK